ncbi:MAG: family 43 glycosylhydrolase [Bryobacterales bacterium]|nr:family 43 glycosylhydrolase [Bryobacterales bacterium]
MRLAVHFLLLVSLHAQHGVIREYAALAPKPGATPLRPLADLPLTDVSIAVGHDKAWYMTGSAAGSDGPVFAKRISIWRSTNQRQWTKLRDIDSPAPAQSPEIHYLRNRYWLTLGIEGGGTHLLAFSSTNLAASPFQRAVITTTGADPSLFLDDDGAFYWILGPGHIAPMQPDPMQGLAAAPKPVIQPLQGQLRSHNMHGAFLAKIGGFYHLFVAERRLRHGDLGRTGLPGGADDTFVAISAKPGSGYGERRYLAFPHAGQTTLFRDAANQLHATFSCTDTRGVFRLRPGAFPVEQVDASKPVWPIGFDFDKPDPPVKYTPPGFLLRPSTAHIYEAGAGALTPIPMDPVPNQRAAFPWIRDTSLTRGHDGNLYMTGTSGNMDAIHLWRSTDGKRFQYLQPVFQLNSSDSNLWYNQAKGRLLWAPEIHYFNNTYYIAWCVNLKLGMGLLKSTSGKPEGPYAPTYEGNRAFISPNIDASLFTDDDGTPYFVWQGRYIRKMTRDLSAFNGDRVELLTVDGEQVGYEGIFLRKIGPWYVVLAAEWNGGGNREDGTYDMMYSVSKNLHGPYTRRRVGVPHGGHSVLFEDRANRWHLAFFGNDRSAPFRAMPGIVPLDIKDTGSDLLIQPAIP